MKVQASAPGKLFLAGEYAVVEAGYPALIAAIDQSISVTIESSSEGRIYSDQQKQTVSWERIGQQFYASVEEPYALIISALRQVESYVQQLGVTTSDLYSVTIETELDNAETGVKYGLGSSGAVTVATVQALLAFYGQTVSPYLVYQLSSLAQLRLGMTGSFGDLAASSYGGVVAYYSVDRIWLQEAVEQHSLLDLLGLPWKGLSIQNLTLPTELSLVIGWTGRAASTEKLVKEVGGKRQQNEKAKQYQVFLRDSRDCVEGIIKACVDNHKEDFQNGILQNRDLLRVFANQMDLIIETSALVKLCQIAVEEGAVAKSSGAGGGDCGICFVTSASQRTTIYEKWQEEGILPLPFALAAEK